MAPGCSLRALQWLEWAQAYHPACIDERTGERAPIRHAYSPGGEYIVADRWPVDGYIDFGHRQVFFEFNGCYWHHCQLCAQNRDDDGGGGGGDDDDDNTYELRKHRATKRREGDEQKYAYLRARGTLVIQRECLWTPTSIDTFTRVPRIMFSRDTHEELMRGICGGSLFGFARARVRFPPAITNKAASQGFLFPPIVRAITPMQPDLLSPWARRAWERAERPALAKRAIVQTYECDDQLLLSETLAYYVRELGAEVKITHFIQYVGEHAFTPFCEKVIALRKRSKRENNAAMGTTAKLIGNSAYGKTLGTFIFFYMYKSKNVENPERYTRTGFVSSAETLARKIVSPHCRSFHVFNNDDDDDGVDDSDDDDITVDEDIALEPGHALFAQNNQDDDSNGNSIDDDDDDDDDYNEQENPVTQFFNNEAVQNDDDDDDDDFDDDGDTDNNTSTIQAPTTITEKMLASLSTLTNDKDFCAEVTTTPSKVTDNKPVVVAHAILQHSKLLLLKFVYYLGEFFLHA